MKRLRNWIRNWLGIEGIEQYVRVHESLNSGAREWVLDKQMAEALDAGREKREREATIASLVAKEQKRERWAAVGVKRRA